MNHGFCIKRWFGPLIAAQLVCLCAASAFANSPPVVTEVWAEQQPENDNTRDPGRLLLHENVSHSGEEFYYEDHGVEAGRKYQYQIGVVDDDGEFFSQVATVTTQRYGTVLLPNSPNPFNPETTIRFTLEKVVRVTLSIYDVKGRRVTTLIDDLRSAGLHEARWDGTDAAGSSVSSGVYFYRMRAGKTNLSRRMVLLK